MMLSGDYVKYYVVDQLGRVLYDTGWILAKDFQQRSVRIYSTFRRGFLTYFSFKRYRITYPPVQVTSKVKSLIYPVETGVMQVAIPSTDASYASSLAKARERVAGLQSRTSRSFQRNQFGASQRPNESRNRNMLRYKWTSQSGVQLNQQIATPHYVRSWTGVRTPNFGRLKAKSLLPVNPHNVTLQEIDNGITIIIDNWTAAAVSTVEIDRFTLYWNPPGVPSANPKAQDRALHRLIDKSGNQINANLAQDLAQIGQTTRLIGDTARRLANTMKELKKGNLPKAIETLYTPGSPKFRRNGGPTKSKSTANNWLEMQYGWKPLLMDVRGSMEALARYNLANTYIHRVSASATVKSKSSSPLLAPGGALPVVGKLMTEDSSTYKYIMRYKLQDRLTAFLAQTGFTNPVNLAWEILPYSFVIDWFLPIGPYLETLSAWDGMQFVDGCTVSFTRRRVLGVLSFNGKRTANPAELGYTVKGTYSSEYVVLSRGKLTSFPSGRFPQFKNPLSTTHALNGLALLRAAFK